jgi:signal transduction histidine kinase
MAEMQRHSLRLAILLAFVLTGFVEVRAIVHGVRSQARLRERVVACVREDVLRELPALHAALAGGGAESWDQAAAVALGASLGSEVEVFDMSGKPLMSRPTVPPVGHWPRDSAALTQGNVYTVAVQSGPACRALTYVPFGSARPLVLRIATRVPDLEAELQERQQTFISHLVALGVLALAGVLALLPAAAPAPPPSSYALGAYEQAMERLRDQGQALSQQHEAERRRMEEQIRDIEAMARAGELTAGIVHEVRNGLSTILGYARLVERGADPSTGEAALRIREECETLETVIRRFMDFVRRETLTLAPFDLKRMLGRVIARESRGRVGGTVTLSRGEEATMIVGDEELVERAFENLVRNAREAAGASGHVWVDVQIEGGATVATVDVSDDGPGLPAGRGDELRPFFTTKAGGLGLGLPIALKIVRLHEGTLSLRPRAPRGLTVKVQLPLAGPAA